MTPKPKIKRVLLVDDDEDDYIIIKTLFSRMPEQEFQLEWISNLVDAQTAINEKKHHAYLIDFRLGAESGLDLLKRTSLSKRTEPFIILTGAGDAHIERDAMAMGVADYLVKGTFNEELLARVLRHSMQRKQLEAERLRHLVELNQSKDEFIAIASHQLRTPATAVKQYIGMVIEGYAGDVNDEQATLLNHAYEGNERQLQIVNDILRVAKLDLEKVNLHIKPISIFTKVKHIVHDVMPVINERSQTLSLQLKAHDILVDADADYLRMALGNILDNASKYTAEQGSIYVSLKYEKGRAIIEIRDEGVGIARGDIPKLFKKFSRIDNPLSVKVGGSGLGLYWSREIIKMHHGQVTVESKIDEGTTFTISLPAHQGELEELEEE